MSIVTIAIDGPAGAGKSTIAKMVSRALGIIYIDTGAMYRTVALKAKLQGIDFTDAKKLAQMVQNINISLSHTGSEQRIFLDGEDVSGKIRTPEISLGASGVASIREVRVKMVDIQRDIAAKNSVVMDGRDIGTYVLPDADLKIFLTASIEERARRRYAELIEKGTVSISLNEVKKDIECRDSNDISRAVSPLKKAEDAVEIDTTGICAKEVVEKIISLIRVEK